MAFDGTLVTVGSSDIPNKYINYESYKVTPKQRQDVDSYRDLDQNLHRNVANNYKSVVHFETRDNLSVSAMDKLMDTIRGAYTNQKERKLKVKYYNPEKNGYDSGSFYLVQPEFTIRKISGKKLWYASMDIEFIEY